MSQTSATRYQPTPRKSPEERRPKPCIYSLHNYRSIMWIAWITISRSKATTCVWYVTTLCSPNLNQIIINHNALIQRHILHTLERQSENKATESTRLWTASWFRYKIALHRFLLQWFISRATGMRLGYTVKFPHKCMFSTTWALRVDAQTSNLNQKP
jgi:hypothetical protein